MRASFHPFLPNGPLGDPLVWIDRIDDGRALLLDLGDLRDVPNRKLLRIDRAVVTHTHLDHFFGFDQLLRVSLTRESPLTLSGPPGFIDNVRGRLAGYSWNLIESYPVRLRVEEIDGDRVRSVELSGAGGLRPIPLAERACDGTLDCDGGQRIEIAQLDHGIPVLGVALREPEHLAIDKDGLERLGLQPGPWLARLKAAVRAGFPDGAEIEAATADGPTRRLPLGELAERLVRRSRGQSLAYLTDLRHTAANLERAVALARDVQLLICEAAFLHEDEPLARARNHLTARQAGELARAAGASRLAAVHLSPRYEGREQALLDEAAEAFGAPLTILPRGPAPPPRPPADPVL